jgi:thioredoxin-like negative regulator of GroEL
MESELNSVQNLWNEITREPAILVYFSTPDCNVCKVLRPKVKQLLSDHFPNMKFNYINIYEIPELSGQFSVFTVPTIVVYFDGKEIIRKSRNFGISELQSEIQRPYSLYFDQVAR